MPRAHEIARFAGTLCQVFQEDDWISARQSSQKTMLFPLAVLKENCILGSPSSIFIGPKIFSLDKMPLIFFGFE